MEFKGTKGKWEVKDSNVFSDNKLIISCWSSRATDESRLEGESWLDMRTRTEPERILNNTTEPEANAKLIACAPELLEMVNNLHQLLEEHQPNWYLRSHHENIVDLIKRATE